MLEDFERAGFHTGGQNKAASQRARLLMLILLAMLTAMEIVLSRFLSVNAWNLKIGFSFVPVAAAAILYGPWAAAAVAGLGDFLGAVLFPIGPYFPGFTATALMTGAVFGLFLHRRQKVVHVILPVAINQLILSLFLNTLWISILYGSPYWPTLVSRLGQCAILIPVQIVVIVALTPVLHRLPLPRKENFREGKASKELF